MRSTGWAWHLRLWPWAWIWGAFYEMNELIYNKQAKIFQFTPLLIVIFHFSGVTAQNEAVPPMRQGDTGPQ
jgi:hypothetical protein